MDNNIGLILKQLKNGRVKRTQDSLDKLNKILSSYVESGYRDFSIAQIGRISSASGGPGYQAIRATRNVHYRDLIKAWENKCTESGTIKNSNDPNAQKIPTDNLLLERIEDLAVRTLFGQILAERNRYRQQLNVLKQHCNITIDRRPTKEPQFLPDIKNGLKDLNEYEKSALLYSISDECMKNNGWQSTQAGQVKDLEYNVEIFPRGYLTGLKKIIDKIKNG